MIDAASNKVTASIPVGQHPSAIALDPDGKYLCVTDSHSDAVSVIDTDDNKEVRRISVAPYRKAPLK